MRWLAALCLCLPMIAPANESSKASGELRIAAASGLKFALAGGIFRDFLRGTAAREVFERYGLARK